MEAIDLGLSVRWASCNIGTSNPFECGDYFAFGETVSKDSFTKENYSSDIAVESFSNDIGLKRLISINDVANRLIGNKWRIPTRHDVIELIENCDIDIFKLNGILGIKVTGRNGNSIFLPKTRRMVENKLVEESLILDYWLSTLRTNSNIVNTSNIADAMGGDFGCLKLMISYGVYFGKCIRPVMEY